MIDTAQERRDRVPVTTWPFIALAAMGVTTPIGLVLIHAAAPGPALTSAALIALVSLGLGLVPRRGPEDRLAPENDGAPSTPSPFAEMIDQIADPILLIEGGAREDQSSRRYVFANLAARELLRIQRADGLLTTIIRAPDILDALDEALFDATATEAEYELRGPQDRFWRARALPLATEAASGGSMAVLWLRDETELRRTERARADFLANASHELRTPLASLTGFIETLRGHAKDDTEARDRFLAIMHGQADRMRRLIDDLMSLSRIELGEHIPPSGVTDLSSLIPDVLDALSPLADERGVSFDMRLPLPGVALATADRDQIVQVIQNLAENAVKYAPEGGCVMIEAQACLTLAQAASPTANLAGYFSLLTPERAQGRTYVAIRVRDFGAGMARSHLPRLTERFYRVDGQKTRKPGTGLGLAIVKHIVNRHRGGLLVESAPGEGAQFTVYLPMAEGDVIAERAKADLTA